MSDMTNQPFFMTALVELQAAKPGDGGEKLRKFEILAYTGAAMPQGWWGDPVIVDLAGMDTTDKSRPILKDHDPSLVVGHSTGIKKTDKSLVVSGVISGGNRVSEDIVKAADNGFPWQASIGAQILVSEEVKAGAKVEVNGEEHQGPLLVARKSKLLETSFVALGADDDTVARLVARYQSSKLEHEGGNMPEQKDSDTTEDKNVQAAADAGASVTTPSASDTGDAGKDVVAAIRAQTAAEHRRIAEINKIAAGHPDIAAKAAEEGWTRDRTELEVLRAERPTGPAIHMGTSGTPSSPQMIEAGLSMMCNIKPEDLNTDERTIEAAQKRWRQGLSLREFLLECAWANGSTEQHCGRSPGQIKKILRAAFSTADISNILSNIANKSMMEGFMAVEQSWRSIARIGSVSNLQQITRYRMTGDNQYEKLAPGGKIPHGKIADTSYTNQADTYAKMLSITRTDIINDDLDAITRVPDILGRGGGLKLNDVVWTAFLANSDFFKSANGNYQSGATTSLLDATGLENAMTLFGNQTDDDGKPMAINPVTLLVPVELEITAARLMNSTELRDTTASTEYGTANPFARRYNVVSSAYLGNTSYTGYSKKAWYLLADPRVLATLEVVFLNNQQAPVVEQADADFDELGIQFRGYHDFGAALQEYRAGIKSKGEA